MLLDQNPLGKDDKRNCIGWWRETYLDTPETGFSVDRDFCSVMSKDKTHLQKYRGGDRGTNTVMNVTALNALLCSWQVVITREINFT